MSGHKDRARRAFLKSMTGALPVAAVSLGAGASRTGGAPGSVPSPRRASERQDVIDLGSAMVGDDSIVFRKHTLDLGPAESVTTVDMNRDGRLDIVSGENWYEQVPPVPGRGPRFIKHKSRELTFTNFYLEDLTDLAIDVNGDGYPDVVSCSYWSKPLSWWENPGDGGGPWREHLLETRSPVEFAFLVDILNTGKPLQLLPQFGKKEFPLTWYELAERGAPDPWRRHEISPRSYGHGIGAGDVNGDGRTDIITPQGWFEAPPDPRKGAWTFHPEFELGATGFIYTEDVNGDGLPDLITSLAHDYGIFWYEQTKDARGDRVWKKHLIDTSWSQAQALTL